MVEQDELPSAAEGLRKLLLYFAVGFMLAGVFRFFYWDRAAALVEQSAPKKRSENPYQRLDVQDAPAEKAVIPQVLLQGILGRTDYPVYGQFEVIAPFDGIVTRVSHLNTGAQVSKSELLVTLASDQLAMQSKAGDFGGEALLAKLEHDRQVWLTAQSKLEELQELMRRSQIPGLQSREITVIENAPQLLNFIREEKGLAQFQGALLDSINDSIRDKDAEERQRRLHVSGAIAKADYLVTLNQREKSALAFISMIRSSYQRSVVESKAAEAALVDQARRTKLLQESYRAFGLTERGFEIRSPFEGEIKSIDIPPQGVVKRGQRMLTLVNRDVLMLSVPLTSHQVRLLGNDLHRDRLVVEIQSPHMDPGSCASGNRRVSLHRIASEVGPDGCLEVVGSFENIAAGSYPALLAADYVPVTISSTALQEVYVLPKSALCERGQPAADCIYRARRNEEKAGETTRVNGVWQFVNPWKRVEVRVVQTLGSTVAVRPLDDKELYPDDRLVIRGAKSLLYLDQGTSRILASGAAADDGH